MSSITLLAFDTSTKCCSVAVYRHDASTSALALVVERHLDASPVSSTFILPAAREVLREAGVTLAECDAIVFSAGPGSFTGLRTACGTVQGLALGTGLPVVPVGTLLACAEAARATRVGTQRVLVALDARMNEAYWADYAWDDASGDWREMQVPSLDAAERVCAPGTDFVVAGNAVAAFGERLKASFQAQAVFTDAMPLARYVAAIAARAFARGEAIPADQAMPVYIRNKVAQTTTEREAIKHASSRAENKGIS